MSNVLKLGKKILTVSTVFSTMLWSVGVASLAPLAANADTCPAFQSGNLIKVSGRAAIYAVDSNGKVLYFPSGDEFKSWNVDSKYGGYTTISQACYDSLPVPTSAPMGVGFRPGSYVVKRASSDQLYVVEPNNTLAKITAEAAKALYGTGYKVMTVADVYWPNYTNRGADVTEAKVHPGMLVSNGGKNWYVNTDGSLSQVSAAGMTANRFKTSFVHVVGDAAVAGLPLGSSIDAVVPAVADRTQTGGGSAVTGTGTVVTGGNLTVSLAANNPGANNLASGTAFNEVLKLNLSAGSADTQVTGLTLTKSGFAANNSVSGVDVVDSSGMRHGNVASSINTDNSVTLLFSGSPIVVRAGSTQTVTIRVNIAGSTGTLSFSVASAAAVMSNGTVGGSFPITGNTFSLQNGNNAVATVVIEKVSVSGTAVPSLSVDPNNEQEIAKFSVTPGNQENVAIKSWTFYNNGNASDGDLQDVQLVAQDGTVLATAQQLNKSVTFNLATPYVLEKGSGKNFTIRTKIVNGASRSIQFEQYNDYDIVVTGVNTGANILPTTTSGGLSGSGTSFPLGNMTDWNKVTIGNGNLSFNKDVTSPSGSVAPGANGVVLGKWYAKPNGEPVELRKVSLVLQSAAGTLASMYSGSFTIKVNGSAVYSGTPTDVTTTPSAPTVITLSSWPTLAVGQNSYITVEANIKSTVTNSPTTTAYLDLTEVKRIISNDIVDPGVTQSQANQISAQSAGLKVTNMSTPVVQTYVVGATQVDLARFDLSASAVSSGEDVKVSSIKVTDNKSGGETYTNIGNLAMYDSSGVKIEVSNNTNVNANTVTFTFAQPVLIPKNSNKTITLKGDVLAQQGGTHTFYIAAGADVVASGNPSGVSLSSIATPAGAGQAMTLASAGTLTVSLLAGDTATPSVERTVTVGSTNNPVFGFRLTAQNEPIRITSLTLMASGTINTTNDLLNVKLYKDNDTMPFASTEQMQVSSAGSTTSTVFTWTNENGVGGFLVQPGTPVSVYVKADIGTGGTAKLGDNFVFKFNDSTSIAAKGQSGTPATVNGLTSVVGTAKSYISPGTVSATAVSPTGAQTTAVLVGTEVAKIKISNLTGSRITLNGLRFTNSGSSAGTADQYKLMYSISGSSVPTVQAQGAVVQSAGAVNFTTLTSPIVLLNGETTYVSVVMTTLVSAANASFQFSIAGLTDITYTAVGTDLGYDPTAVGNLSNTSATLYVDGKPTLGTLTKS